MFIKITNIGQYVVRRVMFVSGIVLWCYFRYFTDIRDLKINVYGKRLTSDTLFAIKAKSLTVCEMFYLQDLSKMPKTTHRDTLFKYRNLAVDIKWFSAHIAWRLNCTVSRLHFTIRQLEKVIVVHERQLESQAMDALLVIAV